MRIMWSSNPLKSKVILFKEEIKELYNKVLIEEFDEILSSVRFSLDDENYDGKYFNVDRAKGRIKGYTREHVLERAREMTYMYIEELQSSHVGDCTCVPCTCMKCLAEELIGVDTIKDLGKHQGSYVQGAFMCEEGQPEPTIEEAIEKLTNYKTTPYDELPEDSQWRKMDRDYYESWIPQWEEHHKSAAEWLVEYKKEKLTPSNFLMGSK